MPSPSDVADAFATPSPTGARRADILCRVVDNFGDAGVCWRLARRLAHGHGWQVRLWVDDMATLVRLEPRARAGLPRQEVAGVEIVHWTRPAPDLTPGEVVIEAFACDPPPAYRARLSARHLWLNLEYLSAESWIDSCHGLPSPQPGGARKVFFFPGFTPQSGGLLREPGLLAARDAFQADPAARHAFMRRHGVDEATARAATDDSADVVTLFCYPDAPASQLVRALHERGEPAVLLLAHGIAPYLAAGEHGRLRIARMPFLAQEDFDRYLWCGDLNFVRGEDSFVRAHWAGRPFVWHIYPQDEAAHVDKLAAWLARAAMPSPVAAVHTAWNGEAAPDSLVPALLDALAPAHRAAWRARAAAWCESLASQPDLADNIAELARRTL